MAESATGDLLEILWRAMQRVALRLCCVPDDSIDTIQRAAVKRGRMICYLDGSEPIGYEPTPYTHSLPHRSSRARTTAATSCASVTEELVKRQLEFRKVRRMERDTSYTSLASLAVVSEDSTEIAFEFDATLPPMSAGMRKIMSTPALSSLHRNNNAQFARRQITR